MDDILTNFKRSKLARIGLRNLKTALAVVICMMISKVFKFEYPFFVVVAAIISMENSLMRSFKAGRSRLTGTFIGAGIGLVCALVRPGSALLSGVGMVVVIYFCNFLKWRKPISIAGIVFMAVMVSLNGKSPLFYSINRIFDTFIGIVVAVGVNYLIFPPDYLPMIRRAIPEFLAKTRHIMEGMLVNHEHVSLVEYEAEIVKANELWELSNEDNRIRPGKNGEEISSMRKTLDAFNEIYRHLRIIEQISPGSNLNNSNVDGLQRIFGWNSPPNQEIREKETDIVFNYHVGKVLDLYQNIKANEPNTILVHPQFT